MNELIDRVDIQRALDRVDLDTLLQRVDLDRLLERVDINGLIDRSNLDVIVARSMSGVMSGMMDMIRAQFIQIDQVAHGCLRCHCCLRKGNKLILPPKVGATLPDMIPCPDRATELAVASQGRSAGMVSRGTAHCIDFVIKAFIVGVAIFIGVTIAKVIKGGDVDTPTEESHWWLPFGVYAFSVVYDTLSLAFAGRTPGKAMLGLLVVASSGKRLSLGQALIRGLLTSLFPLLVIMSSIGLVRLDRRSFLDFLVCTTVVYYWDARGFKRRTATTTATESEQHFSPDDAI